MRNTISLFGRAVNTDLAVSEAGKKLKDENLTWRDGRSTPDG